MQGITIDRQGAFHNRSNGQYAAKPGASSHTDLDWNTNQTQAWANATKTFAKTVNSPEAEEVFDKVRIVKGVGIAVVAAGLVSACGGGSTEAYTPSYPDQDSYNQEADSDTSYDNDYDYTDYDYAGDAFNESMLETGVTLDESQVDAAREALRAMDNETRAGRVVIERDGEWVVADFSNLDSGDILVDEDVIEMVLHRDGGQYATIVVNGINIIHNPRQPAPPEVIESRVAAVTGVGTQGEPFTNISQDVIDEVHRLHAIPGWLGATMPSNEEMPTEIALANVSGHGIQGYGIISVGGTRDTNGRNPVDILGGNTFFETREAADAAISSLLAQFPNIIVHNFAN